MSNPKVTINLTGPFMVILTLVLVILKAVGLINLSWLWVFVPLWGGIALVLGIVAVMLAIALVVVIGACIVAVLAAVFE